jgi:S-adenosylmethionine:tRNA ribosyltransferase-isomerase
MLSTADFDYPLPAELIAQVPLSDRAASRLLVVDRATGRLEDRGFAELPDLIPGGDLVVLNSTKVRHARLLGRRPSGAPAEVLLIHPAESGTWIAMGQPGSALVPGKRITLDDGLAIETVEVLSGPLRRVRVLGGSAEAAMAAFGRLPLPPYLDREAEPLDVERYQTVFAEREGSVAAPTAGLHFTADLLTRLESTGIRIAKLDLEVGPGTFRPVEVDDPSHHPMHPEFFTIPEETARAVGDTRRAGGRVWAVGTTVVRALESAAVADGVRPGRRETELLILPGFRFRIVDRLITNFHLPRSTLLMLVSAFGGMDDVRRAYRHAIEQRYRFYSYGDAMAVV